jgi:serine/threonine protein kinase
VRQKSIEPGRAEGRGGATGPDAPTVRIEIVTATTSRRPPPPLATSGSCPDPRRAAKTLPCVPGPRPLVSYPPPSSAVACYTGTTLDGRYEIERILGEGGMGVVYLARHKLIDKRVAVKILRADFAHQKEIADRFLQEAKAASSIGNPHIVDISDFGVMDDGSAYFVMEWLDGHPLSDLTRSRKPLLVAKIIAIGKQIADGLAAAHARGIVHRDLKPDNVFLVRHGNETDFVKILDFGIAKVSTAGSIKMTRAGMLFGTPHYMSPEQAAGTPVDARTDVYALGVILYELASGRVPFDADNLMGILTQHMYRPPVPLRALAHAGAVSPGLEAIILKALSKQADQRYASMPALSADLDKLERGQRPDALSEMILRHASMFPDEPIADPKEPPPVAVRPTRTPRTPWGMYAGVTAILVACGLVIGIFLQASSSTAQQSDVVLSSPSLSPSLSASEGAVADAPRLRDIVFAAEPLDAHVFRDDQDLGSTPLTLEVPMGIEVRLEVRHPGFHARTVVLDGSERRVSVKLLPGADRAPTPGKAPRAKGPRKGPDHSGEIVNPWGPGH